MLQHRDLLELLLPGLRADMSAIETHVFVPGAPLACPLTVFGGDADHRASPDQLAAWQGHTDAPLRLRLFRGGHFYFSDAAVRTELLGEVQRALQPLRARVAGAEAG